MIPNTMEPIEGLTLLLAAVALTLSLGLLWRSWYTYRAAVAGGNCDAVLEIGWGRVVNEAVRLGISGGVTYVGWVNVWAPIPVIPSDNRTIFQIIWLWIGFACFAASLVNERRSRRIVGIIERERAAGRMASTAARAEGRIQGTAEGRVAERVRADAEGETP